MASFQRWQPLAIFDLLSGLGVLIVALIQIGQTLSLANLALFPLTFTTGVTILYSLLLGLTSLLFWGPGFFYTWLFDGLFQMARYPVRLYPGWLRLILTWIIPVGVMTTVPAQALRGSLSWPMLIGSMLFAMILFVGASALFQRGLRGYASASS